MTENLVEKSTGNKSVPSFIERELLKIGKDFVRQLWDNYGIGIDIKNYWKNGFRVIRDEDILMIDEGKKYLDTQKEVIQKLRARFMNILLFASDDEKEKVAKALGVKANELCGIGEDYENLISSAIR